MDGIIIIIIIIIINIIIIIVILFILTLQTKNVGTRSIRRCRNGGVTASATRTITSPMRCKHSLD
jgi:hypothetical protein